MSVGPDAQPIPQGRRVGMYHFGLKVGDSDDELRAARDAVIAAGATIVASSDHVVTHSLYLRDPDGDDIEIHVDVPEDISHVIDGRVRVDVGMVLHLRLGLDEVFYNYVRIFSQLARHRHSGQRSARSLSCSIPSSLWPPKSGTVISPSAIQPLVDRVRQSCAGRSSSSQLLGPQGPPTPPGPIGDPGPVEAGAAGLGTAAFVVGEASGAAAATSSYAAVQSVTVTLGSAVSTFLFSR